MVEINFEDHANVLLMIAEAQEPEEYERDMVQEQKEFILDSMWDSRTQNMMKDRYRGEFDQISPILDQITGEMESSSFGISVSPAGGGATEDTADVYSGIIRNIENISDAKQIYSQTGQSMVMAGLDGFEVVQKHIDANTFDQDLVFEPVADWYKSVWFDLASIKPDGSDARWGVKLKEMPKAEYEELFPEGKGSSIGSNTNSHEQNNKYDSVTVAQIYYKKPVEIELVKMTSGAVYEKDENFEKIQDELSQQGEVIADERTRKSWRVWSRLLDGDDWLNDAEETVFSYIPLIPIYGNFSVLDTKKKYFGKTKKLMDAQRGINFAVSAETEDVAMTPTDAVWMTKKQGAGEDYSRMNIDRKAVRFYNEDDNAKTPPFKLQRGMGNPAMQNAMGNFQSLLRVTGNMDDPSMGQNPGLQSGTALDTLVTQSNNGNVKWFKAMETALCHAYRVCVDAIPKVYDGTRQQRILGEDGKGKLVDLNTTVFDQQTQSNIAINDLTKGTYDVTCSMGAAFKNQQEQTTKAILDYASVDPAVMEMGRDILLQNQTSPGMDLLADRFRVPMIQNGQIPFDQLTEEEQQAEQERQQAIANQPPVEDPNMVFAQAEAQKAQNEANKNQMDGQIEVAKIQNKQSELELKNKEIDLDTQKFLKGQQDKFNVDAAKVEQSQQEIAQNQQKIDLQAAQQQFDNMMSIMQQKQQELNDSMNNLKVLKDAIGADTIMGPTNTEAYKEQADIVLDKQDESGEV